jgi:hypothetical protein
MQTGVRKVTADIEFLAIMARTILWLATISGAAIATVLVVVLIFALFGGIGE